MNVSAVTSVAAIGGVGSLGAASPVTAPASVSGAGAAADPSASGADAGSSFLNALGDAFGQLNTQLGAADSAMSDFAAGGSADLHTVMLQMEEASISLKAGVQVRDKLLEAYQQIMQTQL